GEETTLLRDRDATGPVEGRIWQRQIGPIERASGANDWISLSCADCGWIDLPVASAPARVQQNRLACGVAFSPWPICQVGLATWWDVAPGQLDGDLKDPVGGGDGINHTGHGADRHARAPTKSVGVVVQRELRCQLQRGTGLGDLASGVAVMVP